MTRDAKGGHGPWGLLAEFHDPTAVVRAMERTREAGYTRIEGYSPFPMEELSEAMGWHTRGRLPRLVLLGGLLGAITGYGLQYWVSVHAYPLNVGGRPLHSWPAFIPVTFEMAVLFASGAAVLGMLALNGLPRPHHPVFNVAEFKLATTDRFFICIEAKDPRFDLEETRRFLEGLDPVKVTVVES